MADTSTDSDIHPSPDEIKEYVSVGPSPDYSITVHKSTFDTGFLLFTIIFGVALIIIVIVIIILSYNLTKPQPIPRVVVIKSQPLTMNSNYGAAPYAAYPVNKRIRAPADGSALHTQDDCLSHSNTEWKDNKCDCKVPFFGETCAQEKHDAKYFAVGVPDESTIGMTVIEEIKSNGKSFNSQGGENSCSDYCNRNYDCDSFIYHSSDTLRGGKNPSQFSSVTDTCTLLTGNIIVPKGKGISYSNNIDSTLYMRTSENLQFEGRIFLAAHTWSFPSRYWLFNQTDEFVQIIPGVVSKINFYPEYIKIYGEYTGIYCPYSFTSENIQDIMNNQPHSMCYIHEHNTTLNVPPDFKYRPIYVTYI